MKLIGVYDCQEGAEAAVGRMRERDLPGFTDSPDGFEISEYPINQDHWTEGFSTSDMPSWVEVRPRVGESGNQFAKQLLDQKYGPGNYRVGPHSEFNKIRKWGDRAFE